MHPVVDALDGINAGPVVQDGAPGDLPLAIAPFVAVHVTTTQRHIDHLARRAAAMVGDEISLAERDIPPHLDVFVAYRMHGDHPAASLQRVQDPGNELLRSAAKLAMVIVRAG